MSRRGFNPKNKPTYDVEVTTWHPGSHEYFTSWTIIASSDGTAAHRAFSGHRRSLSKQKLPGRSRILRARFETHRQDPE